MEQMKKLGIGKFENQVRPRAGPRRDPRPSKSHPLRWAPPGHPRIPTHPSPLPRGAPPTTGRSRRRRRCARHRTRATTPARESPRTRGARPTDDEARAGRHRTRRFVPSKAPSRTRGTRTEESRTTEGTARTKRWRWPKRRRAAETSSSSSTSPTRAGTTTKASTREEPRT